MRKREGKVSKRRLKKEKMATGEDEETIRIRVRKPFQMYDQLCKDNKTHCSGETACKEHKDGSFSCYCTHSNTPVPPDGTCDRILVTVDPEPVQFDFAPIGCCGSNKSDVQILSWENRNSSTMQSHIFTETSQNVAIIASLCSLFLLLLSILTFCFIKRRTLKRYLHFQTQQGKLNQKVQPLNGSGGMMVNGQLLLPNDRFVMNPTYGTSSLVDLSIPIFLSTEINILAQIGQGCFGKVFKGELSGGLVAVKVVKKENSEDALKEVETMAGFNHPNILRMIGIAKHEAEESPWLVFEFMEYGDLASVLRSTSSLGASESLEQKPFLTKDSLFDTAYQVAEGMKYLSSQHFVHRDLAARNCLVGRNGVVKISDFGLSRDVYTCDYYKIGGSRLLPVRWMSPESVLYGRFTLESDVWAYGVLLWEVYTRGKQPYFGHSNEEVVQLILDGVLLCPPSDCPLPVRELMAGCWKSDPKDRLKFLTIIDKFLKIFKENAVSDNCGSDDYEIPKPKSSAVEYMQVV